MSKRMASTGNRRSEMANSYTPRAGRVARGASLNNDSGGSSAPAQQSSSNDGKAKLIPCGGGWKTNWGYSCQIQINGRAYKVMAFWNNKPKGSNPPAINFTIRETNMAGEDIPVREGD